MKSSELNYYAFTARLDQMMILGGSFFHQQSAGTNNFPHPHAGPPPVRKVLLSNKLETVTQSVKNERRYIRKNIKEPGHVSELASD